MKYRKVVFVNRDGEARLVSTKMWREYEKRRDVDPPQREGGDETRPLGSGPCEEACAENGGVDECGATWVRCKDGTTWLIDP